MLLYSGQLEYGALDDSVQIIEPEEETHVITSVREDFWNGFALFLRHLSDDLFEEKLLRKYPSTHCNGFSNSVSIE